MYEGYFLQIRLSKTLDVSVDQKTRPSICFKTCSRAFETLSRAFLGFRRKLKAWPSVWKAWPRVCVITRPMLSDSAMIKMIAKLQSSFDFQKRTLWGVIYPSYDKYYKYHKFLPTVLKSSGIHCQINIVR